MRAVIQRVKNASVIVADKKVSEIAVGMLVLLGIYKDDAEKDFEYIQNKILGLRIFNDANGIMNESIQDINGELLVVSQFTLFGDCRKGKRPSYSHSMQSGAAEEFYNLCIDSLRKKYNKVATGVFGADMQLHIVNDGPVTLLLDSHKTF